MAKKSGSASLFVRAAKLVVSLIVAIALLIFRLAKWLALSAFALLKSLASAIFHSAKAAVKTASSPKPTPKQMTQVEAIEGSLAAFDNFLYYSKSTVGLILGGRGTGKSALGMRLLENWAAAGRKVYALGFDASSLPSYINVVQDVSKAANGSAVLVDEGGILFSSRDAMSKGNKLLSELLFIARHKDLSLVFITQNSATLEVNTIRQADYLLLKKPSLLQSSFERGKIKDIYAQAAKRFSQLEQKVGKPLTYVYSDAFHGFASAPLPTFWSEEASKAFRNKTV